MPPPSFKTRSIKPRLIDPVTFSQLLIILQQTTGRPPSGHACSVGHLALIELLLYALGTLLGIRQTTRGVGVVCTLVHVAPYLGFGSKSVTRASGRSARAALTVMPEFLKEIPFSAVLQTAPEVRVRGWRCLSPFRR